MLLSKYEYKYEYKYVFLVVEHIITEDCKIVKIIEYAFYVWISSSQIKE